MLAGRFLYIKEGKKMKNKIKQKLIVALLTIVPSVVLAVPPVAQILSPVDQSEFSKGGFVLLKGAGNDQEDGVLSNTQLEWSSDKEGPLGEGETLDVELSGGTHLITLTVTDSDNETHTDSVSITVLSKK